MNRRTFLRNLALGSGAALLDPLGDDAHAAGEGDADRQVGVLIDTTRCAGCRMCEWSCAEANGRAAISMEDPFDTLRTPTTEHLTVVNRYEVDGETIYRKTQCMHCVSPACATACLTKAMLKTDEGPIVWREDKCMGCRYCMVSCPFDVPRFEYDSAVPSIHKCTMCYERLGEGEEPACVANCPAGALRFGTRAALLEEAWHRITSAPDDYVHHVYGQHEAGGTGVLYLASVPFEELGLRTDLGTTPLPEHTREFLYAVPVILTVGPALLLGLSQATRSDEEDGDAHHT